MKLKGCIGSPRLDNLRHEYNENPSPGTLLFTRPVTMFEALHPEAGEKALFLEKATVLSSVCLRRRQHVLIAQLSWEDTATNKATSEAVRLALLIESFRLVGKDP